MGDFIQNSVSDGEPKGPPQACLFVANLPSPEVSEEMIRDHFEQFGKVLKVKLIKDRSSRPYAFIQFFEVEDSAEALKSNKSFEGKRLRVERAKVNRTLFIAKLSRNTANGALRDQATSFGPVESVTIIKNHQTNRSKGCGFVKYMFREDAMDAFVGLKNMNHKWVVEWATSTNDPDTLGVDKFNVFLGGLNPEEVTKENIESRFGEYGEIETVSLINKEDDEEAITLGLRSASAFVRFTDASASAAAIEAENGAEWLGRRIRVQYCESAEMKNKRRLTKYSQPYGSPPQGLSMPPYYGATGQIMEPPRPMMMMGGLPMYNIPTPNPTKGLYGSRSSKDDSLYATGFGTGYSINPTLLAYTQPWLFSPHLQPPMSQPNLHLLPPQQALHSGRLMHHMQPVPQHMQHFQQPIHNLSPHSTHSNTHSPRPHQLNNNYHQNQLYSPSHINHQNHTYQPSGRSLQRNQDSPNSDDSGADVGGLTQSVAGWVLK